MTQSALLTFLPVYLANQMGYSPPGVGACLFALQAAGSPRSPIAGHLSDRMDRKQILMSGIAASAVVLAAMALACGSSLFVALVAVLGFFLYATRPVIQAWMPGRRTWAARASASCSAAIGAAVGPLLGGMVADSLGLLATFHFLATTIVIANVFVIFVPSSLRAR